MDSTASFVRFVAFSLFELPPHSIAPDLINRILTHHSIQHRLESIRAQSNPVAAWSALSLMVRLCCVSTFSRTCTVHDMRFYKIFRLFGFNSRLFLDCRDNFVSILRNFDFSPFLPIWGSPNFQNSLPLQSAAVLILPFAQFFSTPPIILHNVVQVLTSFSLIFRCTFSHR